MKIRSRYLPLSNLLWCLFFLAFFVISYIKNEAILLLPGITFCVLYTIFHVCMNLYRPVMMEIAEDYIILRQNLLRKSKLKRESIENIYIKKQNRFLKAILDKDADDEIVVEAKYGRKITLMPTIFEVDSNSILQLLKAQ